jgi:NAD-dependent SIR2 family protein deacetylase
MSLLFGTDVAVRQSKMSGCGTSNSDALQEGFGNAKVALSQIAGSISSIDGVQCFNNYDENLAAVTCPQ